MPLHGSVCTSTESTGGKISDDRRPAVARVGRCIDLPAGRAKVHATRIERIDGHRIAQHVDVTISLRQAVGERLPFVAAGAAAIDAQLAIRRIVFRSLLIGTT